ncbi:MAG: type II toxin-antitoxin system RelB/DinJ family antitoxin [Propionibacteriaceae bacterium]|nr:type II toxin-antitoxin system RelB/DinJ family antitoxin [Propionibacteriaceae bacterium]
MSTSTIVRARINQDVKDEATAVFTAMGLTVSDAFRMLLTRVAAEKTLPFEPLTPNQTTIAAIKQARSDNSLPRVTHVTHPDALLEFLNGDS